MKTTEELLTTLLGYLAEKFKNQLVLKGGMLLRLLNSPRSTQDLDYGWVPTKSREILAEELRESLEKLEGIKIDDIQINSRGIFLTITEIERSLKAKVEISVTESFHLPPKPLSTAPLANLYSLKTQIVATMDLAEAFSQKIAASLERDLLRDLYDVTQMEPLTFFDKATLTDRFSRLQIGRARPISVSFQEASRMLKEKMERITAERVGNELAQTVPMEQLTGLETLIRASVSRVIQRLELVPEKIGRARRDSNARPSP